jgi:hypothetical protein
MRGEVRRLFGDTLVIYDPATDGEWAVPLDWIGSIRVPRHVALTEPPVLFGLTVGTILGWKLGAADWTSCDRQEDLCNVPRESYAGVWAVGGAAGGLIVGGVIAVIVYGLWEEVPL